MKRKWKIILFIAMYVIALAINLIVSVMFPDLRIEVFHFIASILLFIVLIFVITQTARFTNWFLIAGAVSSCFVAFAQHFEELLTSNWALDMLSGIQYPLYVIFNTPLFGLNYIFGFLPGSFALLCAGLFTFLFVIAKLFTWIVKKKSVLHVT